MVEFVFNQPQLGYAWWVARQSTSAWVLFVVGFMASLTGCLLSPAIPPVGELRRSETLWISPAGHITALYSQDSLLGTSRRAIVCEGETNRVLNVLPSNTFPLPSGNSINIFNLEDRATPGWYTIKRFHPNWWDRIFSGKVVSEWSYDSDQSKYVTPSTKLPKNAVFVLDHGAFRKIAEESKLDNLFDAPAEGLVYVGEPGIGFRYSIDLASQCP